jgi:uncharacterized protein (DUF1810 family)
VAGLQRFKDAQEQQHSGFESALAEIRSGGKTGHWIWYVFPQLAGLGSSAASRTYGIDGVAEADRYLRDATLRARYLQIASAVAEQLAPPRSTPLLTVMGSAIDASKLVSSLTLFRHIAHARRADGDDYAAIASTAEAILAIAAAEGYPACAFTGRAITAAS